MANPGKTYELPCHIHIDYGMAGDIFMFVESVKIGKRKFQVNGYAIEVE